MKESKEMKAFNVRLDTELHKFIKVYAAANDTDMTTIIIDHLKKIKKSYENKLTHQDTNV